jgi:hypothetical protein
VGYLLFNEYATAVIMLLVAVLAAVLIYLDLKKRGFETIAE